jgi:hypothetical protein
LNPLKKNPNKIQVKIQLITLANYKPKIIDGAKLNLGILGKKQEGILMCCMSTQIQIKFLETPHFEIKQILRMLHEPTPGLGQADRPRPIPARLGRPFAPVGPQVIMHFAPLHLDHFDDVILASKMEVLRA